MGALFTTTTLACVTDTDESRHADVEGAEEFGGKSENGLAAQEKSFSGQARAGWGWGVK